MYSAGRWRNSSRQRQIVPSLWVERSGHRGGRCRRNVAGLTINQFVDSADQDAFFRMVRQFRAAARDGSLHPGWRAGED